ncbi:hypothetical protein ACJX0J_035368, partial [Zea mays]
ILEILSRFFDQINRKRAFLSEDLFGGCRNDLVFNKTTMFTYLQTVAMQFYSKYGWSFSNRIHRLFL